MMYDTIRNESLNSCVIHKHLGDKGSQDKTPHTAKINAVVRVYDVGISKLEIFLQHR